MKKTELTPEQIANWRKVLIGLVGPYALIMSIEEIEIIRTELELQNAEQN